MNPNHRNLLAMKSLVLTKLINLDNLMPFVISEKIFTLPMLEDIYGEKDDISRKKKFLFELQSRGPKAFKKFIKALQMAHEEEAVKILVENDSLKSAGLNESESMNIYPSDVASKNSSYSEVQFLTERATEETRNKYSEDVYKMNSVPSGFCLIINNVDFQPPEEKRVGSDLDAERLDMLFNKHLGYKVFMKRNLTALEMKETLHQFSKLSQHNDVDSCVVIILSHGSRYFLLGTDNKLVCINNVFEMFDNYNSTSLCGKPKMFFIQACRGDNFDNGVFKSESSDALNLSNAIVQEVESKGKMLPTLTDMLISYSVVEGYISIRVHALGSWYCQALVEVFTEDYVDSDLEKMLRKVDRNVKKRISSTGEKQATEIVKKGWDKLLYFNVRQISQ